MQKIVPDWPVVNDVVAFTTTRADGISPAPWDSLNLGDNCADQSENVAANRQQLAAELPQQPYWLKQVHGTTVVSADIYLQSPEADASWSNQSAVVCAVLTADCLPVLLSTKNGSHVAAVHCGWRSLVAGVLENTIAAMAVDANELIVWFGPAISAVNYEVGEEVYTAFTDQTPQDKSAFSLTRPGHWQADLIELAKARLQRLGATAFYGGHWCTYADQRFYSYRRSGVTGRMASLIYRQPG